MAGRHSRTLDHEGAPADASPRNFSEVRGALPLATDSGSVALLAPPTVTEMVTLAGQPAASGPAEPGVHLPRRNPSGLLSSWALLDEIRPITTLVKTQARCMRQAAGSRVVAGRRADGRAFVSGAKPCGCKYCPNCAPRIQGEHRALIEKRITAARSKGWRVLFLTLTLSHSEGDRLSDLLGALFACWTGLMHGGFRNRIKRRHGFRHFVRTLEVKWGGENGWHPHWHVLLFLDPAGASDFDAETLEASLFSEYSRLVGVAGYRASRKGFRLLEPTDEHLARLSGYFTKEHTVAHDLALEMTSEGAKRAHGNSHSVNVAELAQLVGAGDAEAIAAWRELESATFGRKPVQWSAHAGRDLGDDDGVLAERAAIEPEPTAADECLIAFRPAAYEEGASRYGFLAGLTAAIDAGATADELLWWCEDRGVRASLLEPPGIRELLPPELGPPGQEWLVLPDEHGHF